MSDNSNLAALDHAYGRWHDSKGASAREWLELLAETIEMRSVLPTEVPSKLAGVRVSREQAVAYFEALLRDWEMLYYEVDRYIAAGDDIIMIGNMGWRFRATGAELHTPKVDIWHFENGKATSFFELYDTLGFARAMGAVALTATTENEGATT